MSGVQVWVVMVTDTASADEELLEKFQAHDSVDVDDVPEPIMNVMRYIDNNTGLLGEYNNGLVRLVEGGRTIQWHPRRRKFSTGDRLLQWVQTEAEGVMFGQVATRNHPLKDDETGGYIEIHETSRWVSEE